MKKRLDGLQALHSIIQRLNKTLESGLKKDYNAAVKSEPEAVHPLVRVHPVNGRKCLYVTEGYTVRIIGLPEDESRELIAELTAHWLSPNSPTCTTRRQNDLVMWDDCTTQHKATFDYPASDTEANAPHYCGVQRCSCVRLASRSVKIVIETATRATNRS